MSYIEVEEGRALYAEVTVEQPVVVVEGVEEPKLPLRVGGTFMIKDGDIRLSLVRFDEFFHVADETHLIARTEKNWTASLYDLVPGGSGQLGHTDLTTYHQTILVNTALVGWEPWLPEYRTRRTVFRVPGADYLMRHRSTFDGMANNKFGAEQDHMAVDATVMGGRVRIYYNASGSMDSDYAKEVWPVVELEFDELQPLQEMRRRVITFLRFLSSLSLNVFTAGEQIVSHLSHDEWIKEAHEGNNPPDFSVYYYEGRKRAPVTDARLHGSYALLHDDDERTAFVDCLVEWFARNDRWEGAASAMMDAFSLDDVMSPNRLLNATKWIESTPGAAAKQAMEERHVVALASLLSRHAIRLGYEKLLGRLKNSLRRIAEEQNADRFVRLVAELKATFGDKVVGDDLAAWVAEAFTLRGKAAHRPIISQTDEEYELFAKAVYAAECFAYLMLIRELPMCERGRKRATSSAMVEYYRLEIKGIWPKDMKVKGRGKCLAT
ncbi:hypothetical protein [Ancylobacter sp. SL191]|uniref:hypothetical protein n=1 Tax=Ancylobacter sp. SL191 TaxID=2995166 RepID=UPI00226E743A|nr:hypothetical protein [Ancylobacter sp. SL191]WAC27870.1 hypothetical protein OU996_01975 [Ancylobacter sp. SL191]